MRRRPIAAAGFAVTLFVVGQLAAFSHEAATRHVTCAAHGEQLEVGDIGGAPDDGCGQSHFRSVDGTPGEHQDCPISRLLRTRTQTSDAPNLDVFITHVAMVEPPALIASTHSIDVILIAPKTSPPHLA
jgi:hypothetical protein